MGAHHPQPVSMSSCPEGSLRPKRLSQVRGLMSEVVLLRNGVHRSREVAG